MLAMAYPKGHMASGTTPSQADPECSLLQVRAAATLGGNLVLTRARGLESDAATLLMAAGAQVRRLAWFPCSWACSAGTYFFA